MQTQLEGVAAQAQIQNILEHGDLVMDLDALRIEVKGVRVQLTDMEFALLRFLLLNCGVAHTKQEIFDSLYEIGETRPEIKIIDVFICKVRKKLANASDGLKFIETILGKGYVIPKPEKPAMSA